MDINSDGKLTRREFLAETGLAVAGLAAAGMAYAEEAPRSPVRIGEGHWTYELVEGWGTPPEGMQFDYGCGIVVDSKDRIYVHSHAQKMVVVYDRHGNILNDFGAEFAKSGHGLYHQKVGRDEFLYFSVLAPYHQVIKTDLSGKILMRIGQVAEESPTSIPFPFNQPTDVAIAPNGDIYVCEGYGGNMVHQFTAEGKFIRTIGKPGSGPGEFKVCHGIWVDTRKKEGPELYVADRHNDRVQIFTMEGILKRTIADEIVRNPCCFYQFKGKMYIPDLAARVTILDEHDRPIAQLGDGRAPGSPPPDPKAPRDPAKFIAPHALTVDSHGDMYVVEWVPDARLRKFRHAPAG